MKSFVYSTSFYNYSRYLRGTHIYASKYTETYINQRKYTGTRNQSGTMGKMSYAPRLHLISPYSLMNLIVMNIIGMVEKDLAHLSNLTSPKHEQFESNTAVTQEQKAKQSVSWCCNL